MAVTPERRSEGVHSTVRTPRPLPASTDPITQFTGPYRFLSNFYPVVMPHRLAWSNGVSVDWRFRSAEHAYQASKAVDAQLAAIIWQAPTAADAKRLGREITPRPDWVNMRVAVMREVIQAKFTGNTALADALCDTGTRELIEGNTWGDRFWGVEVTSTPSGAADAIIYTGENWLGRILMERRAALQAERRSR